MHKDGRDDGSRASLCTLLVAFFRSVAEQPKENAMTKVTRRNQARANLLDLLGVPDGSMLVTTRSGWEAVAVPPSMCPDCGAGKEPSWEKCPVCEALDTGAITRRRWSLMQTGRDEAGVDALYERAYGKAPQHAPRARKRVKAPPRTEIKSRRRR